MIPIDHPYHHYRRYGQKHTPLYLMSVMLLFWSIVEGMTSYGSPILILQSGVSKTMMGLILGTASVAGSFFDFILSKYLQNTHFRRLFLLMFIITAIQPLVLWQASGVLLFIIAMGLWGLYFDLMNFATFDFVSRKTKTEEHSSAFGVIGVFRSVGYLIAPIIAGLIIGDKVDWRFFVLIWLFVGIAFVYYLILGLIAKKDKTNYLEEKVHKPLRFICEIHLWKKIGRFIYPVLAFAMLLNIVDNFFWTLGPLIAESETMIKPFNGAILTLYTLPTLFVGWFVGSITQKYGKKRSGLVAFLLGSVVLITFAFFQDQWAVMGIIFLSSSFMSFAWPAMRGTFADYISESPEFEKEIAALEDFGANIGYVIGPILAGITADLLGNFRAFSALGIICVLATLILLKITPKNINIQIKQRDLK